MSSTTSKTPTTTPTADAYRAYAAALEAGCTDDFATWFAGDGQAAITALKDQQDAELRATRQSWARAVARDFKTNGKLTTYSKDRAQFLLAYLGTVDFDALPDPEVATEDEAEPTAPAAS